MTAHLLRLCPFFSDICRAWVGCGSRFGIGFLVHYSSHALPFFSPPSFHTCTTRYSFSPCSLVCGGQTSPHKPRLVVSHSTYSPRSSSPHAHSFVLGTAVINNNNNGACFGFGSEFGIGFTLLLTRSFTRSSPSRHPPFTQYPFPSRSLVRDGHTCVHACLGSSYLIAHVLRCPPLSPATITTCLLSAAAKTLDGPGTTPARASLEQRWIPID